MMHKKDAPPRACVDIGPGDFIKTLHGNWVKVVSNTAFGSHHTPRSWKVVTEDGQEHSMWGIGAYAKAEDFT